MRCFLVSFCCAMDKSFVNRVDYNCLLDFCLLNFLYIHDCLHFVACPCFSLGASFLPNMTHIHMYVCMYVCIYIYLSLSEPLSHVHTLWTLCLVNLYFFFLCWFWRAFVFLWDPESQAFEEIGPIPVVIFLSTAISPGCSGSECLFLLLRMTPPKAHKQLVSSHLIVPPSCLCLMCFR